VSERTRRARYWYSGGARLDTGAEGTVVGFVWTHWLLDRRLQIGREEADEDFARWVLYESQKVAGIASEKGHGGSFVWAGEHVLRHNEVIYESYGCTDIDMVVDALLERGPLVAALTWHGSLSEPAWIDGRAVCRLGSDDAQGGHALLLNGVDLDLELDGVRGFVRFRNSWGAAWGDDGQALISIADLEQLLHYDEVLLAIPATHALPPGGRQDVAEPEAPPGGYGPQSIGSDLWTIQDAVGHGSYAEAIARGIQHEETSPPLTIGIKAPWGAGKTSLMRMIRERLEWPWGARSTTPRALHLIGRDDDRVTNRELLQRAGAHRAAELRATVEADDDDERRWRPTVWFNPWMYQTGEQVWAGLAHEIITQITERMPRGERERFWLELNLRRIDEQAVRRRIYALVLQRLVPWAVAAFALAVAGLALLAVDALAGALTIAAGPVGLAAVAAAQLRRVMAAPPSGALAKIVSPVTDQLIASPDYASQTGVFYLLHADLQRVLDLVATPRRPLVVFVDDLDRCAPGTVVQVIEAINLFLAGQYPNCIFVIAMEPDMVAAHVAAAYGNLAARFEGGEFDPGWRFLEKIVQLPLTLPALAPERTAVFVESLLAGKPTQDAPPEPPAGAEPATVEDPDRDLTGAVELAGTVAPQTAEAEEVRRSVARRLSIDDREVRMAIAYAGPFLDANPREIKRFVNVFRFLVMIHTERAIEGLATTASLAQLAKLALVSTRWPALMSTLAAPAGDRTVFELLEEAEEPELDGVSPLVKARLRDEALSTLLRDAPKVGPAARHYL